MKKPGVKSGRKPPADDHADDDASLWQHTARTIDPLKRGKPRVHASLEVPSPGTPPRAKPAAPEKSKAASKPETRLPPSPPVKISSPPPIAEFDRKAARKIRRGNHEIEARIDLHGMRQEEAHTALRAFVQRCVGSGKRWVLVITGKGKPTSADDDDSPYERRERGVLRRNVPRWLEEPDLRQLVVSYTTAAIAHGGEGALYVHLRTRLR